MIGALIMLGAVGAVELDNMTIGQAMPVIAVGAIVLACEVMIYCAAKLAAMHKKRGRSKWQ